MRSELAGEPKARTRTGLQPNVAGLLCYLFGWVSALVFLLVEKNSFVRFHATQSLIVFGVLSLLSVVLAPLIPIARPILGLVSLVLWIFLMSKAYKGEKLRLPLAGYIADRQSEEFTTLDE
ncbi:MAG TPA: DUF4870 domain-containing protein [Firmicutes bacterium]|nr:DUF4870 domain-containing protein [Bacillota bacterium]